MKFIRAAITFLAMLGTTAFAQEYPAKPVHFIAPTPPGGGADVLIHLLQPALQKAWNRELVPENKAGARGKVGADFVASAAADGYTLLMGSNVAVTNENLSKFVPVTRVTVTPYVLAVNPLIPARDVGELIAYAKKNPGKLRFGSSGPGSSPHLAAELFIKQARVEMRHVASKGTNKAVDDLVDGATDVLFGPAVQVIPFTQNGKLRALASTGLKRPVYLPADLPTVAESLPGYEAVGWFGVFAPVKTPAPIVAKLSADLEKAMETHEVKQLMFITGAETASQGPAEFAAFVRADEAKWTQLMRERGIKPE
jgi:tripartite-type tricarboxylate transporter receptor subunit TctC